MKSELFKVLSDRGFINQTTNLAALDDAAVAGPITAYIGFDLTANSLHVGSLIQIMVLRWMRKLGHNPLILLGDATTRVGDPSGKSTARPILTTEQIGSNRQGIEKVFKTLVPEPQFVTNEAWFNGETGFFEFLQEYGSMFSINRMLTFDSVKSRLKPDSSLSFLEFNYMLMQAVDFFKLNELQNCILQVGGSDQWGNIINGVELTRKKAQREVFGLTTPLMTNVAGEKMGKTASGAVWLDPEKTSAFDFWQFWRNVEDAKVGEFLRLFTELDLGEIENIIAKDVNEAKIVLADTVTGMVHPNFGGELPVLNRHRSHLFAAGQVSISQLFVEVGLAKSNGDAARLAQNGGLKLDDVLVQDVRRLVSESDIPASGMKFSLGKKKSVILKLV
jgi:tyrosyl-tRNA synthetase